MSRIRELGGADAALPVLLQTCLKNSAAEICCIVTIEVICNAYDDGFLLLASIDCKLQEKRKGVSEVYMRRNQLKFSATENETADDAIECDDDGDDDDDNVSEVISNISNNSQ